MICFHLFHMFNHGVTLPLIVEGRHRLLGRHSSVLLYLKVWQFMLLNFLVLGWKVVIHLTKSLVDFKMVTLVLESRVPWRISTVLVRIISISIFRLFFIKVFSESFISIIIFEVVYVHYMLFMIRLSLL